MINFKAKRISPVVIEKKGPDNQYHKYNVTLVKLNPSVRNDVRCVETANLAWDNGNSLIDGIAVNMRDEFVKGRTEDESRYYAITTQTNNFGKMIPDKILGIAGVLTTEDNGVDYIDAIQVRPNNTRVNPERKFKNVGRVLLNSILDLAKNKDFVLEAREDVIPFYQKNGFKLISDSGFMIFKRKI